LIPNNLFVCGERIQHGKTFALLRETFNMKTFPYLWLCFIALVISLSSCEVVGGIFKAGFWTAIIVIVIVVALILWLVGRGRR
jgi:hypothetical protein